MADVQPEDGFTRIANELYEALLRCRVPGRHKDVLHAVIRLTYGYNRPYGVVPSRRIAILLEVDVRTVRRILADLISWRMLDRDKRRRKGVQVLRVQKDYELWAPARSGDARRRDREDEDLGQLALWGGPPLSLVISEEGDPPSPRGGTGPFKRGGAAPPLKTERHLKNRGAVCDWRVDLIVPALLNDPLEALS